MKIENELLPAVERLELRIVALPLVTPFETSFSRETVKEALILRVDSGGATGWGECIAGKGPCYSYETHGTAVHILKDFLIPLLLSHTGNPLGTYLEAAARIRGHAMAKAALENALLDLLARRLDIPLCTAIGGMTKPVPSGISLGIEKHTDLLLIKIGEAVEKKYHRIKVKIKKGRDSDVLERIRRDFPDIALTADANAGYEESDFAHLVKFDRFGLLMLEQPLGVDDLYQHARLQKRLRTPLCLDESIKTTGDVRASASLGSCGIINIKQGRVGGMLASRDMAACASGKGIRVWSGGMLETGIGRAFNIHLQCLPSFTLPGDTSETSRYFKADIADPPVVLDEEGYIAVPEGPGTGMEVMESRLEKTTVWKETVAGG